MPSASATSSTPRATAPAVVPATLQRERELGAHRAHHQLALGVLEERAGERPQVGGPMLARVEPGELHPPGEMPPVEVRHEAARGAQQRGLAVPGEPGEQAELARGDLEADVIERGSPGVGVVVRDVVGRRGRSWLDPPAVGEREEDREHKRSAEREQTEADGACTSG